MGGVSKILQASPVDTFELLGDLVRRQVPFEDHIAAEKEYRIGQGASTIIYHVHKLKTVVNRSGNNLILQLLDEPNRGGHIHWTEIITEMMVLDASRVLKKPITSPRQRTNLLRD